MSNRIYIIGHTIKFSPSTESLHLIANPDISVVLTPACNRLLIYLISNQGVVLSRGAIFSTLWSQYGSTPSNSSLNTYMSLIRKAFVNLGMESEVITTIPKTGFLFNPDIDVEEIENVPVKDVIGPFTERVGYHINNEALSDSNGNIMPEETEKSLPYIKETALDNHTNKDITHSEGKKKNTVTVFGIVVMLIITAISVVCYLGGAEKNPPVIPVKIGKVDTCNILFLPVHAGDSAILSAADSNFIIRQSGFTCKPGGVFYVYADKRVTKGLHGKTFVSYCELRDKSVKNCTDYIGDNLKLPVTGTR